MAHLQHETDGPDGAAASKPRERVAVKGCVFKDGRMLFPVSYTHLPAKAVVFVLAAACLGAAVPVPKAFSRV